MIFGYVESLILVICIDNLLRELLKSPDCDMTLYGYEGILHQHIQVIAALIHLSKTSPYQ